MFKKVLIANRGEIAVRVIQACRLLGISTVAVYSDADRLGLHVQVADQAIHIGPAEPMSSYLNIDAIMQAAKRCGAEAIHPGYGFLAENAAFAKRCQDEELTFIGPPHQAIALMGDKIASRKVMSEKGVPIIPGMTSSGKDLSKLEKFAGEIGFPVIIKAAAGGGGKGMRIIERPQDVKPAAEAASREAQKAFGNGSVYLEKFLQRPRHIEFQVLVDSAGNAVHLFERECSIQRRYQKIVEETPSPVLTPDLRQKMGETATRIAKLADYCNAGTIEFLLDESGEFYFLEMNTRIQVEHPITEMTTGVDLVCEQINIAAGKKLSFKQADLQQRGHAIECRIYAEDPENKFLPSPGRIVSLHEPQGPGIRVDSGIYGGFEIPMHYDPILAKLVVYAEDRKRAISKMRLALRDYKIMGVKNTTQFLYELLGHEAFIAGQTHTKFIEQYFSGWAPKAGANQEVALLAAALAEVERRQGGIGQPTGFKQQEATPWQRLGHWRMGEAGR